LAIAVVGMAPGESKTERLTHGWGFGPYREDLTADVAEQSFQALGMTPYVRLDSTVRHDSGQLVPVVVTGVASGRVKLDANHRLAGKTVLLSIELIGIAKLASSGINGFHGHDRSLGDGRPFGMA
jgi:peptidylprolyl isomerase